MSVTGVWTDITKSFNYFFENTLTGSSYEFSEAPVVNIANPNYADSVFNGSYSIVCEGLDSTERDIQNKLFPLYYVRLDIAFFVKDRANYYEVIEDIEQVIRQMVEPSMWSDYGSIIHIKHTGTSIPEFVDGDQQNRLVFGINFQIRGTIAVR